MSARQRFLNAALACLVTSLFVFQTPILAKSTSHSSKHSSPSAHKSSYAAGVKRDSRGHIARSSKAKAEFMKQTGHPHGRPGYVVDHIVPLKRGGSDTPNNMQWQTKGEAKAKDKTE